MYVIVIHRIKYYVTQNVAFGLLTGTLGWWIPMKGAMDIQIYWLHYVNGKLKLWGQEGDWTGAPKEIIEYRIKTGNQINLKLEVGFV